MGCLLYVLVLEYVFVLVFPVKIILVRFFNQLAIGYHTYTCICTCMYPCIYVCTYVCMCVCMYIYTYAHTYMTGSVESLIFA